MSDERNTNIDNQQMTINRKYKDNLFRLLFGGEDGKRDLLELYNAVTGSNYQDANDLEIMTISNVIYMGMKNDIAVMIDNQLALYEHQSSFNPNMPIRGFMYFGKLYDKYIKQNGYNIYGSKLIPLPKPQYIVFYNGKVDRPDSEKLKLSSAFPNKAVDLDIEKEFEWTATMLNINYGRNVDIVRHCKKLQDYTIFVDKVKQYVNGMPLEDAVQLAVDECIRENVLREFLIRHKAEVIDVCITEYNEEETIAQFKQEAYTEGIEKGIEKGMEKGIEKGIKALILDNLEENIPEERIIQKLQKRFELTEEQAQAALLRYK